MKLNFLCPINRTSYGYHSSYTMKYLLKLGWDVRHLPIGGTDPDPSFSFPSGFFHHDAPCLKLWHQFDMTGFTGSKKIGFGVFELDSLSPSEIHNMQYPDLMIVASKWAKSVCEDNGVKAEVVPLGFDPDIFTLCPMEQRSNTIFGNFGKWEIRKGHDVLIKAFNAAFEKDDDVTLAMMPTNGFLKPEQVRVWEKMYLESKLGDKIQIIPRLNTHKDVFNVMRQVDCGVFPARAEGWNLEALEMMACGKHMIITNCTGHTEFVNQSCRLIDMPDEFEAAYDGIFFNGSGRWRSFSNNSFDQLVEHMRDIHKNRIGLHQNVMAHIRASQFTWEKSTNVLANKILEVV